MRRLFYSLIFFSLVVISACGGGGGGDGGEGTTKPDAPTNVRAMAGRGHVSGASASYNYVVVRWNASSGADSYTIYYDTDSAVTTASDKVTGETNTYHLFTNAPADFNLYFAVTASNSAGESDLSSVKRMAVQIPQTFQTDYEVSYVDGDDGDLMKGVAWSYDRFILYGDGTSLDTVTGLMWQVNIAGTAGWSTALNLSALTFAGYSDWRLPNRRELMSLINFSDDSILADDDIYWTSTTDAQNTDQAWAINMKSGIASANKVLLTSYKILPVRDAYGLATAEMARTGQTVSYDGGVKDDGKFQKGVIWPSGDRFIDNGDTVTDILTGLMWLKNAEAINAAIWTSAVSTASACAVGGYDDWRLPNVRELESLLDMSRGTAPCLPSGHPFQNGNHSFWTSTTQATLTTSAWYINFSTGSILAADESTTLYVWPVRSTQ